MTDTRNDDSIFSMIRLGITLAVYAVVSCTVLAVVNNFTAPKIAQNQVKKVNAAMASFFPGEGFSFEQKNDYEPKNIGSIKIESLIIAEKDLEIIDGDYEKCGDYTVRKTDIDYNRHANNARYIEWIENYLDFEEIKRIEVVYKKELKLDETVEIYKLVENSKIYFKLIANGVLKTIIKITK